MFREFTDVEKNAAVSINLKKVVSFNEAFYRQSPEVELYPTAVYLESGRFLLLDIPYIDFKQTMEDANV